MITALLLTAGALWLIGRNKRVSGIGKVQRIKRRIYKEVSMAQDAGVDFSKKFDDLTGDERDALIRVGTEVGWKQSKRSIESGKSYPESYYGSLRRAWNAVSGCEGIGRAYDVRNANGDVVLTWIEQAAEHVQQEPDAHVLLALPQHVEPKKKKTAKQRQKEQKYAEQYAERESFAREFLEDYAQKHPLDAEELFKCIKKEYYNGRWDINDVPDDTYEGLIKSFAKNELKVKGNNIWLIGVKTTTYGNVTGAAGRAAEALLEAWNNSYIEDGFERNDLDEIRRELLDRAKLMQVVINNYEEYEDKTHFVRYFDPEYGRELGKHVHDYGDAVSGDERYNYLDKINYIVWTSKRASEQGGMTYYPIRSYPDYEGAEYFVLNKYGKSGAKVIPVWDVPIEEITGLGF